MHIAHYCLKAIANNYISILIGMIFTPFATYLWKWINGNEEEVKQHRIRFIIGSSVLGLILFVLVIGASFPFNQAAMDGELLRSGGFKATLTQQMPFTVPLASTNHAANATVIGASMGGVAPANVTYQDGYDMLVSMRVVNGGPDSVAWEWKAFIIVPDSQEKMEVLIPSATVSALGTNLTVPLVPTAFGPIKLDPEHNIIQELATDRLANGAAKLGWLIVHVNGTKKALWGTHFIIQFENAFGVKTVMDNPWTPPPDQL